MKKMADKQFLGQVWPVHKATQEATKLDILHWRSHLISTQQSFSLTKDMPEGRRIHKQAATTKHSGKKLSIWTHLWVPDLRQSAKDFHPSVKGNPYVCNYIIIQCGGVQKPDA